MMKKLLITLLLLPGCMTVKAGQVDSVSETPTRAYFEDGKLHFASKNDKFKLWLDNRIFVDAAYYTPYSDIEGLSSKPNKDLETDDGQFRFSNGLSIRHARLGIKSTLFDKMETQTVGNSAMTWNGSAYNLILTVGETNSLHTDGVVDGSGQFDFVKIRIVTGDSPIEKPKDTDTEFYMCNATANAGVLTEWTHGNLKFTAVKGDYGTNTAKKGQFDFTQIILKYTTASGITDAMDLNDEYRVEYYNLQGVRVDTPSCPGIFVRRQGNKAEKILIR